MKLLFKCVKRLDEPVAMDRTW